jgi:hypothetical protein
MAFWPLMKKRSIGEAGVNQNMERKKYSSSVKGKKNSKTKRDSGSQSFMIKNIKFQERNLRRNL